MKTDIIIVGAGIAGITLARRYAEEENKHVLIVERRPHIGGYCYDYIDKNGICIHKHGPHIFRTDNQQTYKFLSRFTEWNDYQHKVLSYVGGHYYPMPINLDTVNLFTGGNYNEESVLSYFERVRTTPDVIANVKDAVESQIGSQFYEAFFKEYTAKQWGASPEELPASIISRIPIRGNRDNRYFSVRYQGIPKQGYTAMLNNMINHPNIHILLNTDYNKIKSELISDKVYYSGSIDEYYDYCYGKLPYRCVSFKLEEYDKNYYQPVAVVNYPNDYDYTRITEYKHFVKAATSKTVIAKEYPGAEGDPSYPIPIKENQVLYQRYRELADGKNISFIGRLGQYKYFSMDQIVENILQMQI